MNFQVIRHSEKEWSVTPVYLGLPKFKTEGEAHIVVNALETVYHRGRNAIRSELRDLIGAAGEGDIHG